MLREGVINTQREGRGGVCTGSSTLRESFENRFVCISPVKNPFENRFVCISPAKNPFENRFVCTFLVKNPFENRFVCIFPVKDPFENPFGSRFTLCPALIITHSNLKYGHIRLLYGLKIAGKWSNGVLLHNIQKSSHLNE